jgi:2',3'-cyclic-nucleotide 2'-phosphodiesterase (5'-nucleotidase family)
MILYKNPFSSGRILLSGFILLLCLGCSPTRQVVKTQKDDSQITVAIVQMNDVYEIAGVDGGKAGGLHRVAGYYKQIKQQYPQSMMVLAGDFLNPSLIGTIRYEGERIKGRQMVDVLNAMDLDLVAFGNHEFDLDEKDLQARINESHFDWIATNIRQVCGDKEYPFYKEMNGKKQFLPETQVFSFVDADGTALELGFFSATISSNPRSYVHYHKPDSCIQVEMDQLRSKSDIILGLTHLSIDEDLALASKLQDVPLIMGGHEHDHMIHTVGHTVVAKADANAKTVYLHLLHYNRLTDETHITSKLVAIDHTMSPDEQIQQLVNKWNDILNTKVKEIIPEPYEVVYNATEPLDGRESSIRHHQTNMGMLFTEGMLAAARHGSVAAILNGGAIRIDDQISGAITAIDIFRALPFGGTVCEVELTGQLLQEVLTFGLNASGKGAFLQHSQIRYQNEQWLIAGQPLKADVSYTIALNDFLLTGLDIPFLHDKNPGIIKIYRPLEGDTADLRSDLRKAIISYLKTI